MLLIFIIFLIFYYYYDMFFLLCLICFVLVNVDCKIKVVLMGLISGEADSTPPSWIYGRLQGSGAVKVWLWAWITLDLH